MPLKPQDVLIVLKLQVLNGRPWTYQSLASALYMSPAEVHGGVRRAIRSRLLRVSESPGEALKPIRKALLEFLVHGLKYAFPPERGELTRGLPTSYAASPLRDRLLLASDEPPPVWPFAQGPVRGYAFSPLYRSVPQAAADDDALYQLLTLVDALRDGRAREQQLARQLLEACLAPVRELGS